MEKYISYREIPHQWGLSQGDVVLLSSNIFGLMVSCMKNKEVFDGNAFLNEVLSIIGKTGTLLLPTFNWDFCHNILFDYYKTPSATGSLSSLALSRDDFRRTKHPIYSFAVTGKYRDFLCELDNESSFGADSPFAFLELIKAKNITVNVNLTDCFTFVHYVETRYGVNTYRYSKSFEGQYIDKDGMVSKRCYSMLVRDLEGYYQTDFNPLEDILLNAGAMSVQVINCIKYRIVDLFKAAPLIMSDIKNNSSKSLCKHKWQ